MNTEEGLLTGEYRNYEGVEESSPKGSEAYENDLKVELKYVLSSSAPLAFTFFLQYLLAVTSIVATGKIGAKELAAATLGVCTFNITGLAVYQGMATSLDTFCSQAFGSGNLHNVGVYFQRCSAIMMTATIPLALFWWNSDFFLKFLVSDAELIGLTQTYLRYCSFGAPGYLLFESGKRFLQAQHIYKAGTYVLIFTVPLNLLLNWLLVWHPTYGLGYIGAPIVVSIIYWTLPLMSLLFVVFIDGKQCWNGIDITRSFSNWKPMLKLALPGVIMIEAEYLAFEVLTIFAASFGTTQLAAQSIGSSVGTLAFQLPFAFAVATSTRIGHYLGSKNLRGAKLVVRINSLVAGSVSILNFSLVFFGRGIFSKVFTKDEDVLALSKKILSLVAFNQLADGFNVLGAGVLRGQGNQRIGSILNMISYYVIALPFGYVLAFNFNLKIVGLWIGLISGVFFLALSEFFVILNSDWKKILHDSISRQDH